MFKRFVLHGNRDYSRTDEQMRFIDKTASDMAFKKYSKDILGEFLKQNGFVKWKASWFVRYNPICLLECIYIQKERYGSKTFTVNYFLVPLYVSNEYMTTCLRGRLGDFINGKDIWWDYADDKIARTSFQNVTDAIQRFLLPFFQEISHENNLKNELIDMEIFPEWLYAINYRLDKSDVIEHNIQSLKLPKSILTKAVNNIETR